MSFTALYRIAQIRAIEQAAFAVLPSFTLMQRAAQAVANTALTLVGTDVQDKQILILAGPGNNGGDALEASALLSQQGLKVSVLMLGEVTSLPADARTAYEHAKQASVCFLSLQKAIAKPDWNLVIDGLFGIGLQRTLDGAARQLVETFNARRLPVLAIDIPSGLNADTGSVVGQQGVALYATHTLTFIGNKPGLYTMAGRDYSGMILLDDLNIESALFSEPAAELNTPALFHSVAQSRPHASHKGSYGDVAIIGGASGMAGAVILAARMASYAGAGRVFAGFIDHSPSYDSMHPELMCRAADQIDLTRGAIVIGPGLGTARHAHDVLAATISSNRPLVIDADGLNILAQEPGLTQKLIKRQAATLLTPHPLEAARLLNCTSEEIQSDRLHAATMLAAKLQAVVILKGSGSVIADPDGKLVINPTGNPALATAGSGDVLAGLCGALLARSQDVVWETALAAVWLHGEAADRLLGKGIGPAGLTASELLPEIRHGINQLQPAMMKRPDDLLQS